MSLQGLQFKSENKSGRGDGYESPAAASYFVNKLIVAFHVCIRCGRKLPMRQGRRSCPHCSGLLVAKITVVRETYFLDTLSRVNELRTAKTS